MAWGMDVLLEVHNDEELDRALALQSPLLGINNRDLKTFAVSLQTTERLARRVPDDRLVISESGIRSANDMKRLREFGVHCALVGESLMRQPDVTAATLALLRRSSCR